jgi:hypothetical protein
MLSLMGSDYEPHHGGSTTAIRLPRPEQRSAWIVLLQVLLWAALVKVGLLAGAALGAASQYLANG